MLAVPSSDPSRRRGRGAVAIARTAVLVSLLWAGALAPSRAVAAPDDDAAAVLAHARAVLGFAQASARVIHYRAVEAQDEAYQSDRSYPPFFSAMISEESWFDPATGVLRTSAQTTFPGGAPAPSVTLSDAGRGFAVGKEALQPLPISALAARYLNPRAVIADWSAAGDVRSAGNEVYRDYVRRVLVRATPEGEQRLFLDPKAGVPIKLELIVKHYLWGQRRLEYVYSNWMRAADILVPGASFCLADGAIERSQTVGEVDLVARAAAPSLALPEQPVRSPDELPRFLQPLDVTTTAVGPATYLIANPGYTEAVTKVGDEVIVFDATQSEQRARKDDEAIARLFPGPHKITVVVTDLAWPHIAGVRYWVARGATIVTHEAGRAFLRSVIDRRWTLAPDLLEQRRKTVTPKLVGVTALTKLAGGAVSLHPIDGVGGETAVMAYLAADRFLWASDFIQTVATPSLYADDVLAAVRRDGLHPERTAAEHLPLTPWSRVEALAGPAPAAAKP